MKTKTKQKIWCIILTLGLILFFATGCKSVQFVPVDKVQIEYRDRYVLDSVFYRDTTRIHTRGDTVFVDVVRWRERFKTDTLLIHKTDSIPVIVEVPVEVSKLNWWQNIRLKAFNIIVITLFILLLLFFIRK